MTCIRYALTVSFVVSGQESIGFKMRDKVYCFLLPYSAIISSRRNYCGPVQLSPCT